MALNTRSRTLLLLLCCLAVSTTEARAADPVVVDIAFFYTQEAQTKLKNYNLQMDQVAYQEVFNINESFKRSGVNGLLKLVAVKASDITQYGCLYQDLESLTNSFAPNAGIIRNLRETFHADVAVLVVDEPVATCGTSGRYGMKSEAYIVVNLSCMGPNFSLARQLGYLAGCGNHQSQSGRFNSSNASAQGFLFAIAEDQPGISYNTIMGYTDEMASFQKNNPAFDDFHIIYHWSNPAVNFVQDEQQFPTGDEQHNNAAQLNSLGGLYLLSRYKVVSVASYARFRLSKSGESAALRAQKQLKVERVQLKKHTKGSIRSRTTIIRNSTFRPGSALRIGQRVPLVLVEVH